MDADLGRLAAEAGLYADYWDISGQHHVTTPETARLLLGALGLPADTDLDVRRSLEEIEAKRTARHLPPVMVFREGDALNIPLTLGTSDPDTPLQWTVTEENGAKVDGELYLSREAGCILQLDVRLPCGYHLLSIDSVDEAPMSLIVAPRQCYLPMDIAAGRHVYGLTAQLYSLRSVRNWGIGDFRDLGDLAAWAAGQGAATVVLNPFHALFLTDPESASPYYASSRQFLNPLYLALDEIEDFAECEAARARIAEPGFAEALDHLRASDSIDYGTVSRLKREILELLFASFRTRHMNRTGDERAIDLHKFRARQGEALASFALFEALSEKFETPHWQAWPAGYRGPGAAQAREFARQHHPRLEFFQYLQWQCDRQLEAAADKARRNGMNIGLCRDLAVGCPVAGADGWRASDLYVDGARFGAPPDAFNPSGQEWGLAPMHPHRLRAQRYQPFIDLLRANMRHSGALRIDHVMWIARQFWVPTGESPATGTYIHFPFDDLLGILALESQRNRCVIIGEDLGTVPENFRERMAAAQVLSSRVLYFEREHERFRSPKDYPYLAAASVSTHDLPTLKGFWTGADLAEREELSLFPSAEVEQDAMSGRRHDRATLASTLREAGYLPDGVDPEEWSDEIWRAVHLFLAETNSALALIQMDDLTSEEVPVNLPGTSDKQRPNWRRRLSQSLEEIEKDQALSDRLGAIRRVREGLTPRG